MRICILSELFYPYLLGGAERRYWEIAKRLAKRGHDVTAISLNFEGSPDYEEVEGVKIVRVGRMHPMRGRSVKKLPSFWSAGFRAMNGNFDIIDANQGAATFAGLWKMLRLTRRPIVLTFHDIYWRQWKEHWGAYSASHFLGTMLELGWSLIARGGSKVIVNSSQTKEKLSRLGVKKADVIVSGIDFDMIKAVKPAKAPKTIVYVGRLESYKRVDMLIDAMASSPLLRKYKLVVMGSGKEQSALEELARKRGVKAEFLGFVPEQEKIARLKGAEMLVNPSLVEGLGLIVLEGMACGTPAVVFDLECYREFCGPKNSVIVKEQSPRALAKAMEMVARDKGTAKRLSMEGLATAEDFSWDRVAEKVEKVYEGLLGKT